MGCIKWALQPSSVWLGLANRGTGRRLEDRERVLFSDSPVLSLLTLSSPTEEQSSHPRWPFPSFPLLQLLRYLISALPHNIAWSWGW